MIYEFKRNIKYHCTYLRYWDIKIRWHQALFMTCATHNIILISAWILDLNNVLMTRCISNYILYNFDRPFPTLFLTISFMIQIRPFKGIAIASTQKNVKMKPKIIIVYPLESTLQTWAHSWNDWLKWLIGDNRQNINYISTS